MVLSSIPGLPAEHRATRHISSTIFSLCLSVSFSRAPIVLPAIAPQSILRV